MTSRQTSVGREAATLAPPIVFLAAVLELATRHGAEHSGLALAGVAVMVTQVLPGALLWRLLRPVDGWLVEDLVVGLGIGAALAVPVHLVGSALGSHWLDVVVPLALAIALLAIPSTRGRIVSRTIKPLPWLWGTGVALSGAGPLLGVLTTFKGTPLSWRGWATFYVDVPYHDALAGELMNHALPHYPQVAQEPLAYHWFAHAWTAEIATVSGTPVDELLWRFNPTLLMVAAPLVMAVAAMRLSRNEWAGPAAALLMFLLADVTPWARSSVQTPLHIPMSPTQQFSVLMVGTLLVLLTLRWRGELARWSLPLLLLLVVITGGSKGSALPVVFAGCLTAIAAVALLRVRQRMRSVALDGALIGLTLILLNLFMFGGGDGGVAFDFGHDFVANRGSSVAGEGVDPSSVAGVVAGVLAVLGFLLGAAAAFGLLAVRETRRDPLAWLLFGGGASGLGALVGLTHPGGAQFYFYAAAMPFIALAGAWGVVVLVERSGSARAVVGTGAAIGIVGLPLTYLVFDPDGLRGVTAAVLALMFLLSLVVACAAVAARVTGTRRTGMVATVAVALFCAGLYPGVATVASYHPPKPQIADSPQPAGITFADVQVLRWLKEHSSPDDVLMTNNHCRQQIADPCDRRRFFVGAFAERRVLIEGWTYSKPAAKLYPTYGSFNFADSLFWDQELLELNDGFIKSPDAAAAAELWDLGVRWVVEWRAAPHAEDLAPYAKKVQQGRAVTVYKLVEPR